MSTHRRDPVGLRGAPLAPEAGASARDRPASSLRRSAGLPLRDAALLTAAVRMAAVSTALLTAAVALAQTPGPLRVHGTVHDLDDRPLAGAAVRLTPAIDGSGRSGSRPERATAAAAATDAGGAWATLVTEAGHYVIEIEAAGYLPAQGWVHVLANGPTPPVDVRLRSLDEVSPAFSESPATMREWLIRANALLAAGRTAEARAEYEKAVAALPEAERPAVLRAVARTHYLEGDVEASLAALVRALAAVPDDIATRELYLHLARETGHEAAAEETLARLDRDGVGALPEVTPPRAPAVAAGLPPEIAALEVEPPVAGRRGRYRTSFSERSPLSAIETFRERFGLSREDVTGFDPSEGAYDPTAETFHVWVPEGYEPGTGYGLFVWISPTSFGGFVSDDMADALAAHRLVWVGADGAGNPRARWDRAHLALDAAHHLQGLYDLDPDRVFVGGYSGGGRLATAMATLYPEVFRGAFALFGADHYASLPVSDKPGASWPARFPPPPAETRASLRERTSFVLLTGELDFNRAQVQAVYRALLADGFERATLLEVPGASHYTPIDRTWLGRGFTALEEG